jgi:alpha-D-xyloside xylohydrolase
LYLPGGQGWYNLYSGKFMEGGKYISEDAPYERTPVFVKEGSIIPFGPELQYTSEKPADTISLYVYTGKDASFTLYEDENTNYNYEKGAFTNITFIYDEAKKQLQVGARTGNFPGMIQNRTFRIIKISKESPQPLDFEALPQATISYSGSPMVLSLK